MEVLDIGGKEYVKASQAADKAGYTSDYVGQLCRSGAIDAHLVGRSWYVDVEELMTHRKGARRSARRKAREQVKKAIEQHKKEEADNIPKYLRHSDRSRRATYEADEHELIPAVQKSPKNKGKSTNKETETVKLPVTTQPDYAPTPSTTKHPVLDTSTEEMGQETASDFLSHASSDAVITTKIAHSDVLTSNEEELSQEHKVPRKLVKVAIVAFLFGVIFVSFFAEAVWVFSAERNGEVEYYYTIHTSHVLQPFSWLYEMTTSYIGISVTSTTVFQNTG